MDDVRDVEALADARAAAEMAARPQLLRRLHDEFVRQGDVVAAPDGSLCFANPELAKQILANDGGRFDEHSDFFHLRRGTFGPREAQQRIARAGRDHLKAAMPSLIAAIPGVLAPRLATSSVWPDEGNLILYALTADLLIDQPRLRPLVEAIVVRSVLAGARQARGPVNRLRFRLRVMRELSAEVRTRQNEPKQPPRDLLDVVVVAAGPYALASEIAEVFLSFLFAMVGSIGFMLGWSVFLLGTCPPTSAPSDWVVREALRLWPVAWFFGRTPARPGHLAGRELTPSREVTVCTYLVHRHPDHWPEPDSFRPQRWASMSGPQAYLPFGWGPHSCTGASIAIGIASHVLDEIRRVPTIVEPHGNAKLAGAALAPPQFTLRPTAAG